MESLGEGIDIPGESLQFVFIDKILELFWVESFRIQDIIRFCQYYFLLISQLMNSSDMLEHTSTYYTDQL